MSVMGPDLCLTEESILNNTIEESAIIQATSNIGGSKAAEIVSYAPALASGIPALSL
jgi:hypothetical protein